VGRKAARWFSHSRWRKYPGGRGGLVPRLAKPAPGWLIAPCRVLFAAADLGEDARQGG